MYMIHNFINKKEIDDIEHNKMIDFFGFNSLTSKIKLRNYNELRNQVYWLSAIIYKMSILNYFNTIEPNKKEFELLQNNLLVFHPFLSISGEICKLLNSSYLFTPLTSTLARSLIEQICLIKEIKSNNIDSKRVVEAMIQSHNNHVGSKNLNIPGLNLKNPGVFKVLPYNIKLNSIAKKYKYGWAYNFFSGDIHAISTIEKLIPSFDKCENPYNEAYLLTVLSLLNNVLIFEEKYNTQDKNIDLALLKEYEFIIITDS